MAVLNLTKSTTVAQLKKEFNETFGAVLRIYSGRSQAEETTTLGELGLSNEGTFECRSSLTVVRFIERMQNEFALKVKVYTCDDWVAALDGLTLESAGKVKKNAVKADMESMIAYQRTEEVEVAPEEKTEKSTPAESFSSSAEDCASAKVRVYGKAQNRTALGIVHAYMVMYPHATLADLRKAFPNSLNATSGQSDLFLDVTDSKTTSEWYFVGNDEIIKTGDNKKVALVMMWAKPAFEAIVAHARVYDIVVAKFEAVKGGVRGGFRLEYLNGYVPPKPEEKKSKWWLWLIIIALLAAAVAFYALRKPEVVEKEVIVEKVVYVERIAEIEKNFNAAQFEKGKTELSEDAKFVLHDLAKVLNAHENIKLSIEGHTSAEGDADFNQKLSEARAKAAVDFLVNREGISESRLAYEGFGSTKLKNTEDPNSSENRRIEFIIIE
jgi:outer membrane protein OmpA-like peptidoglycan-associated protein